MRQGRSRRAAAGPARAPGRGWCCRSRHASTAIRGMVVHGAGWWGAGGCAAPWKHAHPPGTKRSRASRDDTLTDTVLHPARLHELLVPGQLGRLLPVIQQHLRRAVLILIRPVGTRGLAGALHDTDEGALAGEHVPGDVLGRVSLPGRL